MGKRPHSSRSNPKTWRGKRSTGVCLTLNAARAHIGCSSSTPDTWCLRLLLLLCLPRHCRWTHETNPNLSTTENRLAWRFWKTKSSLYAPLGKARARRKKQIKLARVTNQHGSYTPTTTTQRLTTEIRDRASSNFHNPPPTLVSSTLPLFPSRTTNTITNSHITKNLPRFVQLLSCSLPRLVLRAPLCLGSPWLVFIAGRFPHLTSASSEYTAPPSPRQFHSHSRTPGEREKNEKRRVNAADIERGLESRAEKVGNNVTATPHS